MRSVKANLRPLRLAVKILQSETLIKNSLLIVKLMLMMRLCMSRTSRLIEYTENSLELDTIESKSNL
jgi:hypothetical protein